MNRKEFINCHWTTMPITVSKTWAADCNTLTFWNQGTQNVKINGVMTLTPGMAFSFECYPGEMSTQSYDITFTNDQQNGCFLIAIYKTYP